MRISNYPTDTLTGTEMILATNVDAAGLYNTVNFTADALKTFVLGGEGEAGNQVVFEGTDGDQWETILTTIEPTGPEDNIINLPNVSGTIGVFSNAAYAVGTELITATPAEVNYLDITVLGTSEPSKAVTADTDGDIRIQGINDKDIFWDRSEARLTFDDNTKLYFGTDRDLLIYHNGDNSYIDSDGSGILNIRSLDDDIALQAASGKSVYMYVNGGQNGIIARGGAGAELYYSNVKRFETTSTGATITGTIIATIIGHADDTDLLTLADGVLTVAGHIVAGEGKGLWFNNNYHTGLEGSDSTDTLKLITGNVVRLTVSNTLATFSGPVASGAITASDTITSTDSFVAAADKGLWFASNFHTGYQGNDSTDTLTLVTGNVARLIVNNTSATFSGAITGSSYTGGAISGTTGTFTDHIVTADNKGLWFNSNYHTGIEGNDSTDTLKLITGNVVRLTVNNTGATINGDLVVTGAVNLAGLDLIDNEKLRFGTENDLEIFHDGTNSYITNAVGVLKIATETSGIAVTIGHTTSEVTIADNLTVTGGSTFTDHLVTTADKGLWFNSGYETGYSGNDSTNTLTLITGNIARLTITPTSATFAGTIASGAITSTAGIAGTTGTFSDHIVTGNGKGLWFTSNYQTGLEGNDSTDTLTLITGNAARLTINNTSVTATVPVKATQFKLSALDSDPANNAEGTVGDIKISGTYIYVCTVTGGAGAATWRRAELIAY